MYHIAPTEPPIWRPTQTDYIPSAMKGVDLTSTSEILDTPSPAELANLFKHSPKVGLNSGKIFEFEEGGSGEQESEEQYEDGAGSPSPLPKLGKEGERED